MTEPVLPIAQGDWVATKDHGMSIQIGRVRASYWDREPGGKVCMDVVLYDTGGVKIGRDSIPLDGPKSFEPSLTFDGYWQRIDPPRFPLDRHFVKLPIPDKPGSVTLAYTYQAVPGVCDGITPKPVRTKAKVQSYQRTRSKVRVIYVERPEPEGNGAEVEASSMRRTAQLLYEEARLHPGALGDSLKSRAATLEADAEKISPRFA